MENEEYRNKVKNILSNVLLKPKEPKKETTIDKIEKIGGVPNALKSVFNEGYDYTTGTKQINLNGTDYSLVYKESDPDLYNKWNKIKPYLKTIGNIIDYGENWIKFDPKGTIDEPDDITIGIVKNKEDQAYLLVSFGEDADLTIPEFAAEYIKNQGINVDVNSLDEFSDNERMFAFFKFL